MKKILFSANYDSRKKDLFEMIRIRNQPVILRTLVCCTLVLSEYKYWLGKEVPAELTPRYLGFYVHHKISSPRLQPALSAWNKVVDISDNVFAF